MAQSSRPPELGQELFDTFNTELQGSALKATRNAVFLPQDLGFYRSLDRGIAKEVDACSSRVLSLTNRLLDLVSTGDSSSSRSKGKARLEHDDLTDNFRSSVVDAMDQLLERADICMDEFLGLVKQPAIAMNPKPAKAKTQKHTMTASGRLDPALQHASHLPKPQLKFKRKADNTNDAPWQPSLRHKYNAQVPLGYDMRDDSDENALSSLHPYRYEIKHIEYPAHMFRSAEPIPPKSFEETPFTWVADASALAVMLEKLRGAKEIAIDLEYHSYRSFYGFVCLMQISTRDEDFVVDTLAVREELEELNEVFTDPSIVKVLHGAESDIVWLQQDFNLYIVNLFDTYHASKVLDFPRHSLATLMEMYCDFTADKRYQLADWRIRPLPAEMLDYARSDTHFLLFIYDNLRNALLDRAQSRAQSPSDAPSSSHTGDPQHALVREVLSRSEETALRVVEREVYDAEDGSGPSGWDTLARKWNKGALMAGERETPRRRIYKAVHAWRDRVAREEDESTRYVLPNHHLFVLAEQPPADIAGLLARFQHVPPVVRRRARELLAALRTAADAPDASPAPAPAAPAPSQEPMQVDGADAGSPKDTPAIDKPAGLWPTGRARGTAASSALFGEAPAKGPGPAAAGPCTASRSSLFVMEGSPSTADRRARRLRDVVARIQGALAIAPAVPTPAAAAALVSKDESAVEEEVEEVPGQVVVPFVPAAERQEVRPAAEAVQDTLVVVGAAQRKKRKRAAVKAAADADADAGEGAEEAAFDYGAVSNILDEGSDHEPEAAGGRKRRQKMQGRFDYGNFRAPPKAQNEPKSGNQSRTFK
ncbi:Exosome complex exonuclease rrp6 [Phanerochaete sordida]|uniref:Exosome complex exonuclease rrp6 n=1 Tax=Phanerochaete sordida TaxID=48140 RepID=A0A9P3G9E6_9APHY|nr:Exosome complex exonuclease rrp6 [Phanerochaete sordida]